MADIQMCFEIFDKIAPWKLYQDNYVSDKNWYFPPSFGTLLRPYFQIELQFELQLFKLGIFIQI